MPLIPLIQKARISPGVCFCLPSGRWDASGNRGLGSSGHRTGVEQVAAMEKCLVWFPEICLLYSVLYGVYFWRRVYAVLRSGAGCLLNGPPASFGAVISTVTECSVPSAGKKSTYAYINRQKFSGILLLRGKVVVLGERQHFPGLGC